MATAQERVVAGAAMLDGKHPDWFRKISRETLQIASTRHCICGQLYGDYNDGIRQLGYESGVEYGFTGSSVEMNPLWVEEIDKRLQPERELVLA